MGAVKELSGRDVVKLFSGEPGCVIEYRVPVCTYCGRRGPNVPNCVGCGAPAPTDRARETSATHTVAA